MIRFEKKDSLKVAEKERLEKESQVASDMAIAAAQECLRSEMFQKYRSEYEQLESTLIEQLIYVDMTEFDPVQYGFRVKDILSKYRHIGSLLRGVLAEAGKK